jgi:hypothetical protein
MTLTDWISIGCVHMWLTMGGDGNDETAKSPNGLTEKEESQPGSRGMQINKTLPGLPIEKVHTDFQVLQEGVLGSL